MSHFEVSVWTWVFASEPWLHPTWSPASSPCRCVKSSAGGWAFCSLAQEWTKTPFALCHVQDLVCWDLGSIHYNCAVVPHDPLSMQSLMTCDVEGLSKCSHVSCPSLEASSDFTHFSLGCLPSVVQLWVSMCIHSTKFLPNMLFISYLSSLWLAVRVP